MTSVAPLEARWCPAESQGDDPRSERVAGALVLLHGRGADEHDLYPLLDLLDPERRLLGVTPRGRSSCRPAGATGTRWAGSRRRTPRRSSPPRHGSRPSSTQLPVPANRLVLGGFSQGTVMSWAMALGPDRPRPAGLVALSGFLPRVDGFPLDPERLAGVPVAVAHGSLDPVIPARFGAEAAETLAAAGADVVHLESPVPHMIDPAWLDPLRDLVSRSVIPR